jgi:single-stranded-DNA-specific exonuclease
MVDFLEWRVQSPENIPDWFLDTVRQYGAGQYAAQLLWRRGIREPEELAGFLNPDRYQPSRPFAFGEEMQKAIARLQTAREKGDRIVIWGDFDADGITATAVLLDGLGQFFPPDQLTYFIPNRLTESHGLSVAGIDALDCELIVTCDTGSTDFREIQYARERGIDVIVTDHHTLSSEHSPALALINPRNLSPDHPLAHLSGVAVAYKLVEALYETLPDVPQKPLEDLLDLVAIGLIADLVQLSGDGRYLAQRGIAQLQKSQRPGVVRLLELCQRSGDRPTDISFGLGPRINAISRIHGDARFCVELLTSQDQGRCRKLAEETELANARRKSLQKDVAQEVRARIAQLDLSTVRAIVLSDPQWSVGVLGLVAGQMVKEYGCPVILLSVEEEEAKGSARCSVVLSPEGIQLYSLLQEQAHLLTRFGGHPLALGLSLPVKNIELLTESINRQLRQQQPQSPPEIRADLTVTVTELGQNLFRELKLLEPYGIGNPVPRLLIQNCWFERIWHRNIEDWRGRKVRYIKTEFELWDEGTELGFPGVWWEHYRDEIPPGRCDAIAELDFNTAKKRYEIRLIALRPTQVITADRHLDWLLDWRGSPQPPTDGILQITECPSDWDELQALFRQAVQTQQKLAIAYPPAPPTSPRQTWQTLVGIAKYLSRTGKTATRGQILQKLGVGERTLEFGIQALIQLGCEIVTTHGGLQILWQFDTLSEDEEPNEALAQFLEVVQEEQFRRRYFYEVPMTTLQAVAYQTIRGLTEPLTPEPGKESG